MFCVSVLHHHTMSYHIPCIIYGISYFISHILYFIYHLLCICTCMYMYIYVFHISSVINLHTIDHISYIIQRMSHIINYISYIRQHHIPYIICHIMPYHIISYQATLNREALTSEGLPSIDVVPDDPCVELTAACLEPLRCVSQGLVQGLLVSI